MTQNKEFKNDVHNSFSPKNHVPAYKGKFAYKGRYLNQLSVNKGLLMALGIVMFLSTCMFVGQQKRISDITKKYELALKTANDYSIYLDGYSSTLTQRDGQLAQCLNVLQQRKSVGKVSFYTNDGCLGCNDGRIMSNGKKFDENKLTLAHNKIPLGTLVLVKNLDNGLFTEAEVTDRGGFGKYNRIADLSKATCEAINCKTDISNIEISY